MIDEWCEYGEWPMLFMRKYNTFDGYFARVRWQWYFYLSKVIDQTGGKKR